MTDSHDPTEPQPEPDPWSAVWAVAFTGCLLVLAVAYQIRSFPETVSPPPAPFSEYDPAPMVSAVEPGLVENSLSSILEHGSRYPGQPGHEAVLRMAEQRYRDAGLEVYLQEYTLPVPVTHRRDLLDESGQPLAEVEVYPFFPNLFQPQHTPEEGVTGTLVRLNDDTLQSRHAFTNVIGVLDVTQTPSVQDLDFLEYARMGIKGLILTHPDGLRSIPWDDLGPGMMSPLPIQFPRLAASPAVLNHLGQQATLHVHTRYEPVKNRNVVGVLKAGDAQGEALIINGSVDGVSFLPDQAHGGLRALSLAMQFQLLEGLLPFRDELKRDVVFLASSGGFMEEAGQTRLLEAIGPAGNVRTVRDELDRRIQENRSRLEHAQTFAEWAERPDLFADAEATEDALNDLSPEARRFFENQILHLLTTRVFELTEERTQGKIRELKAEYLLNYYLKEKPDDPELEAVRNAYQSRFADYREIKTRYDEAYSRSGMSLGLLMRDYPEYIEKIGLPQRFARRMRELQDHHERRSRLLAQDLALHEALAGYSRLIWLQNAPVPSREPENEAVTFAMGFDDDYSTDGAVFMRLMDQIRQRSAFASGFKISPLRRDTVHHGFVTSAAGDWSHAAHLWQDFQHPAFLTLHVGRTAEYRHMHNPFAEPWMTRMDSVDQSLKLSGETVLSMAFGNGIFSRPGTVNLSTFDGQVLVSNIGQSIIPNYALPGALVGVRDEANLVFNSRYPRLKAPLRFTDPYGRYAWVHSPTSLGGGYSGYSPQAFYYDQEGQIQFAKDEGDTSQRIYRSTDLSVRANESKDVSIVLFRAAPVTVLDMINPQTMNTFMDADYISQEGLTVFDKFNRFKSGSLVTTFIEPGRRFYVRLRSGAAGNPDALAVRAFILGVDQPFPRREGREIEGAGFWPLDHPLLRFTPFRTADSMIFINGKRLDLQNRYNMADEQTRTFHERSKQFRDQSRSDDTPFLDRNNHARDATTYAILNHPVLRENISEAIIGILWYLALLVPFCFFFEKLVFGFSDIRKQIAAMSVIFLVVFALLRILHPAFLMIRSSVMILLGFIILLISGGITALFMSKFQENLEVLRKQQGRIKAAEVNTAGAVGMAFMLGLNNMHKRKIRTGLTCATLVLMTFVMISFTSTQSSVVERTQTLGRATYQGMLFKDKEYRPVSLPEINALHAKFGADFTIAPRTFYVGMQDKYGLSHNPEIELLYDDGTRRRSVDVASMVELTPQEPLQDQIRLLSDTGWFPEINAALSDGQDLAMLPLPMAEALGIQPSDITPESNLQVSINGVAHRIHGIFDPDSMREAKDLDRDTLLPFNLEAMPDAISENRRILGYPGAPRFAPEDVVLIRRDGSPITVPAGPENADRRDVSVSVVMPDLGYREARETMEQTMEQRGTELYYGLDQIAYVGKRSRESSVTGMIDMLIPLVIAALTVLNTMKGSVYERRDEIYVYNAVGIAPKYIFSMFFAEAFVYAVVGSVLGYILSQGTGRILTELGMTGGLNMTYTSLTTIYASLTIAASVFVSTIFPARSAVEIASPSEESGWDLPEPEGDTLSFNLPFTFTSHDRMAVLAFFHRYFMNHSEGSAGPFFCADPQMDLSPDRDPLNHDGLIPRISASIWLKPFDLGVSQDITIELPIDEETGEFIARISLTRGSGTHESWLRLNRHFVILVRRHFLHWRAVSDAEREEMFEEARDLFTRNPEPSGPPTT